MISFLADEDFNWRIVRGIVRSVPGLDLLLASDAELLGEPDLAVVSWAAANERVLLTHDVNTMTRAAMDYVRAGHRMPGLVCVPQRIGIGPAIKDLIIIAHCLEPHEIENQIWFLPL